MYRTFRRIVFMLVLCLALLIQSGLISKPVYAENTSEMDIGDYIQFGRYYNEPIQWRVININDDGSLMLLSEKILSLKPFDANGDLTDNRGNTERINFGSNNWEKSNLREWLNSDSEIVNYSCQIPDDSHVNNGNNNYESEAGFLHNFTNSEQDAIQPHTYKTILSSVDSNIYDGGSELYTFDSNVEDVVQNFDQAYYKNVNDKVFLLDVKELHDYVFNRGYEHRRKPTKAAVAHSEYSISSDNYWYYWLRTPNPVSSSSTLFICYEGIVNFDSAFNGDHGLLPALNLKSGISAVGGDGTEGNPYVVIGDASAVPMAPMASNVQIIGDARSGSTLTGTYMYSDWNGDIEASSTYRWLESDAIDGEYKPIVGESSVSYVIKDDDIFKYLKFEVTPKTTVEPIQGNAVRSAAVRAYKSDNAKLAYLKYNGISIADFNPNLTEYKILLPGGSNQVPTITAKSEDSRAEVQIINATGLPGTTVIKVTAEDGSEKIYNVSFSVAQSYIESAHPYTNNLDNTWTYTMPIEYSAIQVTFSQSTEVEEGYDFIYIMDGNNIPVSGNPFTGKELAGKTVKVPGSTVRIRLTSDSDDNKYGFAVTDIQPDLSLTSIKVNGTDIDGFEPSKYTYRYVLPKDISEVPLITAEAETGAVTTIVPASTIPGITEIKVLDNSGNLIKTYVIELTHLGEITVGDYIQFGRYYKQPILWRVINENSDGSFMLLSEKILSMKPFDANGDFTDGRGDSNRINYGSNNWEKSNLREWLNGESMVVNYTCQPADDNYIENGNNNYENEAGFLSNFTISERDIIQPVMHRSILSAIDRDASDGGTELHIWKSEIKDIVQNFDDAYYKDVTDKVFLLDIKELHDYVYNRGYEYKRKLTAVAEANSEYKVNNSENWYYWLRTPCADNSYLERFVFGDGGGYDFLYAYDGKVGVLPALNLKPGFPYSSGNGSESNPYLVGEVFNLIGLQANYENKEVSLNWNTLDAADCYKVYKKQSDSAYCWLGDFSTPSFTDVNVQAGNTYTYAVSAVIDSIEGQLSAPVNITIPDEIQGYSADALVQIDINPKYHNCAGVFIGLKNIKDPSGLLSEGSKVTDYQVEIDYNPEKVTILDVIDELNLSEFNKTIDNTSSKVSVIGTTDLGTVKYDRLFFVPLVSNGSAKDFTDLYVKFINITDNQNKIQIPEPYNITLQRGKVVNRTTETNPDISDAIAGLQYLAGLREPGFDEEQVNLINLGSIYQSENETHGVIPNIKDIIALMQYIVDLRNDNFEQEM